MGGSIKLGNLRVSVAHNCSTKSFIPQLSLAKWPNKSHYLNLIKHQKNFRLTEQEGNKSYHTDKWQPRHITTETVPGNNKPINIRRCQKKSSNFYLVTNVIFIIIIIIIFYPRYLFPREVYKLTKINWKGTMLSPCSHGPAGCRVPEQHWNAVPAPKLADTNYYYYYYYTLLLLLPIIDSKC